MIPAQLTRALQDFLSQARCAAVFENDEELFIFAEGEDSARYSISGDDTKCLLHLWSSERNLVRRVLECEAKKDSLVLSVQRFGQAKPARLEIVRDRDRRTVAARKSARMTYARLLERVLARSFPDLTASRLSSAVDLERSFGPIYARGTLGRGRTTFAVLGINAEESQASIDAALTFGLLWLDSCRESQQKQVVEGLKLIVPRGTSAALRERMACLNGAAAKFELYEREQREHALEALDCSDRGNIRTNLVRAVDQERARERFSQVIRKVLAVTPQPNEVEIIAASPVEISFRLRGLEFARATLAPSSGLAAGEAEIIFGAGAHQTSLNAASEPLLRSLVAELFRARRPDGERNHPLWRMRPERWLESLVVRDVTAIDSALDPVHVYSQVPAFSASDRAIIDVLAATREGRLTVIELKADEDIHLPLQGLDYWARVAWHHERGEFQRYGYFAGRESSQLPPRLLLVAPALHIHPATDALLKYLSPEIDWELAGVDEHWRDEIKVIFRKRSQMAATVR